MKRILLSIAAFSSLCLAADAPVAPKPAPAPTPASALSPRQVSIGKGAPPASPAGRNVSFVQMPLSFEPNVGQSASAARFTARTTGYSLELESSRAKFKFAGPKAGTKPQMLNMELVNANRSTEMKGENQLLGKANYFPTSDPKTWFSNIPTYSRVHYSSVYPGVDVAFYGNANRLEYDFTLQPGADPAKIRMKLTGSEQARIDSDGNLVLRIGKDDIRFLKPVAYQTSADGSHHDTVLASYRVEQASNGKPAVVSFNLGSYDRKRTLVIDPVLALSFSEYLNGYVADTAVDGSGNIYLTGQYTSGQGFYVDEYNSSGALQYTTTVGTNAIYPFHIRVDGTGRAYVAGYITSGTLPTTANAYKSTVTSGGNGFLVQLASGTGTVSYATFIGATDTQQSAAQGLGVQTISGTTYAYVTGWTQSTMFPTTAGVYQPTFSGVSGNYDGFVAQFNPAAATGPTSLVYSTYLGGSATNLAALAVDGSGNTYVTGNSSSPAYPVTNGAFQYSGAESGSGGVYVTKLNPTGTALVYSAYLGYGWGYGIAVDGQATPNVYVTGPVYYADFPTTTGAYQTSYAGGFVVKLSSDGSSEVYSTFLGGPSSVGSSSPNVIPWSLALPNGCASNCNAYISGYTNTPDFPAINAIQSSPSASNNSAFMVEVAANGNSALFSSYLTGLTGTVYNGASSSNSYGFTPAIAVDNAGKIALVGDTNNASDFPITITNANPKYAFLAQISPSASPFTWSTPASINFANQVVGVSTAVYNYSGTVNTVTIRNISATAVTISSIQASPSSIFSESDACAGTIPAGGTCVLTINFTPAAAGARTGTVTVNSNASNSPTVVNLTANGFDDPYDQASASNLAFGNQNVGTTSAPQTVTLTNTGDESANAPNIYAQTGTDFTVLNNCPIPFPPGATCTVTVTFTPTQTGERTDTLYVTSFGPANVTIPLSGTGLASGANGTLGFSAASLDFGTEVVGVTTTYYAITIQNTGSVPIGVTAITYSGDFGPYSTTCGALPFQINPEATCIVYSTFTPSAAGLRTGNLTFTDSASGSPQSVPLSGTGLAGAKTLEFYPYSGVNFGSNVPVGLESGAITVYAYNVGTNPITIGRVVASGDFVTNATSCNATTIAGTTDEQVSANYCSVAVYFKPTAAGLRTGTLTFIDNASNNPQVLQLSGNAIAASGAITVEDDAFVFNTQVTGTTSANQSFYLVNPGDTPITVNSYGTGTGNFAITNWYCPASVPFTLAAGGSCGLYVSFTPTATGTLTDTFTVHSSAGNATASLSGTGVAASQAIGFTPGSIMNSGSVVVGQTSGANGSSDGQTGDLVSIRNTGTSPVTFGVNPAVSGTNMTEFVLYNPNSCGTTTTPLQPGASCPMWIRFTPAATGARTATLTFTDSAPGSPQSITLNGTGISANPTSYLSNNLLNFDNQVQGSTSSGSSTYIRFYNNSGASVILGNIVFPTGFIQGGSGQTCNGQTIANGGTCYTYVSFAPTTSGLITGTISFPNNSSVTLASATLTGFAPAPVLTALLTPDALDFVTPQVVTTTSGNLTTVLTNTGNLPLTVGTITGTNLGATPTNEFTISSNGCGGQVLNPGGTCTEYVDFTPNAAGTRNGTITFPVTYTGGSTANLTATLTGPGAAVVDSAVVQPGSGAFLDQTVGVQTSYVVTLYLVNRGNQPFKVGSVTGVNTITSGNPTGEFSIEPGQGGSDGCSGQTSIGANTGYCQMNLTFTPSATGTRTGSITFPVTFTDNTTTNVTANLSGNGVAAAPLLQFQPYGLQFAPEIQGNTSAQVAIAIKNVGNKIVHFSTQAAPSAGFVLGSSGDGCFALSLNNLAVNQTCYIYVSFAPTTTGNITGTLTVSDNATGGPHALPLSGTGITAAQQIVLSQSSVTFGNQPQGSTSSPQIVYVTNQSDTAVTGLTAVLGGTNMADFTLTNGCGTGVGARAVCKLTVVFAPAVSATGTRTAMITLTDSDSGSPRVINLTGTAVVAGPAIALSPASPLTFTATWNVGTTSTTRNISARNTGSANVTISSVALSGTNAGDFAIVADGCSGATLTPGTDCKVGVQFTPLLGGTRTANVSFTDNAAGSPQVEGLSATGHGIPMAVLSASTLTYAATNIGTTTAAQSVTLSNPGTDVLNIASIAKTGPNPGDFTALVKTCGATLAPGANCTISTAFDPTATGSRTASIITTSNANNVAGSTATVILNGTGLGIPSANLNLNTLSFGVSNVGTATASQTVILSNPGTNVLNIASIVLTGTNPGDFTTIVTTCGSTLAVGANCTISTSFLPTAAGSRSASILITDNNGGVNGSTQSVALSGTGGIPTASPSPAGPLTYANTLLGAFSAAQTVTLTNTGTGPLTVTGVSIGGANPGDFGQTNNCSTVAPSGTCTISVQFGPTVVGARAATLQIVDNSGNVPGTQQNIALTGTGYGVPKATVAPSPLNFGNSNIGTATAPQSVTLTNAGTDTLVITKITLNGVEKTDFTALGGTCPVTFPANLAAGGSCTISTSFLPTAVGTRTANINVVDNAGNVVGAKQNVNMNGTGVGIATASVTPGPLNFSQTLVGTTNPTAQTVTVSNTGTATLTVTSVALVGTNPTSFAQTNNCGGVAVGGNCTVTVKFAPAAPGALTATLQVTDNSGNVAGTQQNVTLNGTGVTPVAPTATSVAPSSFTGAGPENFVFTYTDSNFAGSADLNTLYFLFTRSGTSAVNACYGYYVKSTNQIFLYNNAGTALVAGSLTPGTAGTLANSQCSLNGATSATSFPAGSTATLTLATTALAGFPGTANIFGQASDNESQTGALGFLGNWNTSVEVAPTLTSVTPIAGSGLGPQQFTFVYSDGNGSSDLNTLYANINGSVSTASACSLTYAVATNELTLSNQAGTGNVGIIIPGQAGTLTNNQCSVDGASAVVTPSGNTYTMSVTITFAGTFTGSKNVYMKATDNEGQSAGYTKETTYTP